MRANLSQLFAALPQGAVGCFNVLNLDMALAVLNAAELTQLPVAIGLPASEFDAVNAPLLTHSLVAAIHTAKVPAGFQLDRLLPADMELAHRALDCGFTTIMFDGSGLSWGQCAEQAARLVDTAGSYAASVELKPPPIRDLSALARLGRETGVEALVLFDGIHDPAPTPDTFTPGRVPLPLTIHGAARLSAPFIEWAIGVGVRKVTCAVGLMNNTLKSLRLHATQPVSDSSTSQLLRLKDRLHADWVEAVATQLERYANPVETRLEFEPGMSS